MITRSQQTARMSRGYHYIPTGWTAYPTLGTLAVGSPVSVVGGSVVGFPTPTVTYSITVGGVVKTWPYTLVSADAGAVVVVTPKASGASGTAFATVLTGTCPVPGAAPGPVTALGVRTVTTTGMTPFWSPPVSGGAPTSYDVGYRVSGGGAYTTVNTTSTSQVLSGLTANTAYDIIVTAKNAGGSSSPVGISQSTASAGTAFYPANDLGIGVPPDNDYDRNRIYSDRGLGMVGLGNDTRGAFYNFGYVAVNGVYNLPDASQDQTTGMPLTAFAIKLCEGNAQVNDPTMVGTWFLQYTAAVKRVFSYPTSAAEVSHTLSGGIYTVIFTYGAAAALIINVDGPITSFGPVFNPENSATAIATGPGSVPRWNPAYIRTITNSAYTYLRLMDVVQANSDYVNTATTRWKTSVGWADRITPSNYYVNTLSTGVNGGMPVEWQVDLANTANKDVWLNISCLADDGWVTNYFTYVANNLAAGKKARFELANERWNLNGSFYSYKKTGVAGMLEAQAAQPLRTWTQAAITSFQSDGTTATVKLATVPVPGMFGVSGVTPVTVGLQAGYTGFAPTGTVTYDGSTTLTYPCTQPSTGGTVSAATVLGTTGFIGVPNSSWSSRMYEQSVVSLSSTGSVATVVFNGPHGASTGQTPVGKQFNGGYTGFAPNGGATLTVVDAKTISYPCSQAVTTSPVPGDVALSYSAGGFIACNGASTLFTGGFIANVFGLGYYWFHRRQYEVALLAKNAWAAAGRNPAELQGCFMLQYATPYVFGTKDLQAYIRLVKGGAEFKDVFKASSMGGYFSLDLKGAMNLGFGYTQTVNTPTDQASFMAQLRLFVDHCYGVFGYTGWIAWCKFAGLEAWCYESGIETSTATAPSNAFASAANIDALAEGIVRDWIYGQVNVGFTVIGWYQGGASFQSGAGCFNAGQTVAELDASASPAGWGAKFKGLLDSRATPSSQQSRHSVPCTISGYDAVGNEAVVTNANVWPALTMSGLPNNGGGFGGPISAGTTYWFWSETAQTLTFELHGHTTGSAQTLTVQPLNGAAATTMTVPGSTGSAATDTVLGTCAITLAPGPNYIFVSAPTSAGAATVFPHALRIF